MLGSHPARDSISRRTEDQHERDDDGGKLRSLGHGDAILHRRRRATSSPSRASATGS